MAVHHGESLAKKGIVMVTFNYRLNIMGFFAHPDVSKESPSKGFGKLWAAGRDCAKAAPAQNRQFRGDRGQVVRRGNGPCTTLSLRRPGGGGHWAVVRHIGRSK
jgi:carboxylesterase type B